MKVLIQFKPGSVLQRCYMFNFKEQKPPLDVFGQVHLCSGFDLKCSRSLVCGKYGLDPKQLSSSSKFHCRPFFETHIELFVCSCHRKINDLTPLFSEQNCLSVSSKTISNDPYCFFSALPLLWLKFGKVYVTKTTLRSEKDYGHG